MRSIAAAAALIFTACATVVPSHDVVIRNAMVYDGSGDAPVRGGVVIDDDRIVTVGDIGTARGTIDIDAQGKAVAPGFINMLSWATVSLIADGRSQSDIRQGVTLEIFGEGVSMGPLNDAMKREMVEEQGDIKFPVDWTTLGQYLDHLAARGISPNVASFVGAGTVRRHVLGENDVYPTPAQLAAMERLVADAMREGAIGLTTTLIYKIYQDGFGGASNLGFAAAESIVLLFLVIIISVLQFRYGSRRVYYGGA